MPSIFDRFKSGSSASFSPPKIRESKVQSLGDLISLVSDDRVLDAKVIRISGSRITGSQWKVKETKGSQSRSALQHIQRAREQYTHLLIKDIGKLGCKYVPIDLISLISNGTVGASEQAPLTARHLRDAHLALSLIKRATDCGLTPDDAATLVTTTWRAWPGEKDVAFGQSIESEAADMVAKARARATTRWQASALDRPSDGASPRAGVSKRLPIIVGNQAIQVHAAIRTALDNAELRSIVAHTPIDKVRALSQYLTAADALPQPDHIRRVLNDLWWRELDLSTPATCASEFSALFASVASEPVPGPGAVPVESPTRTSDNKSASAESPRKLVPLAHSSGSIKVHQALAAAVLHDPKMRGKPGGDFFRMDREKIAALSRYLDQFQGKFNAANIREVLEKLNANPTVTTDLATQIANQQRLLDLIDVATGQGIDGQRARTLVNNAFHPDQPAPTEDLISRAAKLMAEAPSLPGADAWKAVAFEAITAEDFQPTALDSKQSARATSATASQRWRVMYPIAAPIAAEPAPVAVSLIANGFQNWGQLNFGGSSEEQYLQAMSVVLQMDDLAAKGDPSFTQDEANQRKFQLIAFAEQFVARDHETPAQYIDFPPSKGITARFEDLMRWVASCKSSDRASYLPTRAALPLIRQMLEGQENFDYQVFVHGVTLAGAAPQLHKLEVRALTTQLERAMLDLPQLPAKYLQSSFQALRAMANKVEPTPPTSQHSSLPRLDELERRISSYMEAAIAFDEEIAAVAALPPAAELEPAIEY